MGLRRRARRYLAQKVAAPGTPHASPRANPTNSGRGDTGGIMSSRCTLLVQAGFIIGMAAGGALAGDGFAPNEYWLNDFLPHAQTVFADVTGDGKSDAITVSQLGIVIRRSTGTEFGSRYEFWTPEPYYGSRGTFFADVDGDGKADAIVVNEDAVTVRRSDGVRFGAYERWTERPYYGSRGTFFADVTGDGRADAIVVNNDGVTVRRSDGLGFGGNESWTDDPYYGSRGTFFADVTGDGRADAIVVNDFGVTVRRSAGGFFKPNERWTSYPYYGDSVTTFADVTGDGRADAIVVNRAGVAVARSDDGVFQAAEWWTSEPYYGDGGNGFDGSFFADVTGDGRADAIVVLQGTFPIVGGRIVVTRRSASSTPDFQHSARPHADRYSTTFGLLSRPMLVILERYAGVPLADSLSEENAAARFFGHGYPSLAHYFRRNSSGRVNLFPVQENSGVQNDGVVIVDAGDRAVDWARSLSDRITHALKLADPFVDFKLLDSDGDGLVENDDLVVVVVHATGGSSLGGCGAARHSIVALDGKTISVLGNIGGDAAALMTFIHEMGHQAFGLADLYNTGIGPTDIMAATCGLPDTSFFSTTTWHRMHLGWNMPRIIEHDRDVLVEPREVGDSYLLYNPAKGAGEYFIVENIQRPDEATYDSGASLGLKIWRVDDSKFGGASLQLINPSLGGPTTLRWADGTPAGMTVQILRSVGKDMLVRFDVP
jgi:M6 family metalloprotease-like protein